MINDDLARYLTAKIREVVPLVVHDAMSTEVRDIVRDEVKSYLSRFMLVIAQPNDKS
jgi:hypothetical protein